MADTLKPFSETPGRDTTNDQSGFDIARCYYDQRSRIAEDADVLRRLMAAVDSPGELAPVQWAQWYAVVRGFAPSLILELGRGRGNSTALFAQAASRLGHTRIVSLCQNDAWAATVVPRIARIVDRRWFDRVDARLTDILTTDYGKIIAGHEPVLVLWDAHGLEIAEVVLGDILPRLLDRPHLVLIHDIIDNRYGGLSRSYDRLPLWKGLTWQKQARRWDSRVNIGWMNSIQDQVIALADFSARNDVAIGSADHEFHEFFSAHPAYADEMRQLLGDDVFSAPADWAFLSLTGKSGPFHFPAVTSRRAFAQRSDIVTDQLLRLPATIVTEPKPWMYASKLTWRPASTLPSDVQAFIRCRVQVEGGAIGVGLLSLDEKEFVETQVVSSAAEPVNVMLPVADLARRGPLVIYTWAAPESARVRIDDLSLVW